MKQKHPKDIIANGPKSRKKQQKQQKKQKWKKKGNSGGRCKLTRI